MSSWDVYWLLKLDDFGDALKGAIIFSVCIIIAFIALAAGYLGDIKDKESEKYKKETKFANKVLFALSFLFALFVLLRVFIPSTKQMAVIYVAPKIASVENLDKISAESKEIYGLAKTWLKEQVKEDKKE